MIVSLGHAHGTIGIIHLQMYYPLFAHTNIYIIQGTLAATDMSEENFVTFSPDLTEQEYFNFSVSCTNLKWSFLLYGIVQVHLTCSCV